jgi:serine phosphatase RsbU (regulator of sigma subunit)
MKFSWHNILKITVIQISFVFSISTSTVLFAQSTSESIEKLDLEKLSESDCLYLDSCLSFSNETINNEKLIDYYTALSDALIDFDNYLLALPATKTLIDLLEKSGDNQYAAELYMSKSLIHDNLGQYPEALTASQKALKLFIQVGDREGEASSYNDIGVLHYYSDNLDQAQEYFDKSRLIYEELKDTAGMSMYFINMANTLYEQDEFDKAISYYQSALEYSIILKDLEGQSIALSNIGETYTYLGEYDKAESVLLESLVIAEEYDDPWTISNPLRGLGELYQLTDENHKAIKVLKRSVDLCLEIGALAELSEAYELLYILHKSQGQFKDAMVFLEMFKETNDSLFDQSKERMISEMEITYQIEDKAKEIEILNKTKKLDDLNYQKKLDAERNKLIYLVGGLIGIAIILLFAIRGIILKKKANEKLQEQNTIIQDKNEQINTAYSEIEVKNNEILDSIRYAKRIQSAILPAKSLVNKLLPDSFILYKPKDVVAGDFYWLQEKNDLVLFAAADCTGHGVPGAMVSVVCNNGLNRAIREHGLLEPGKILDKTREIVIQEFEKGSAEEEETTSTIKDGMDIALCAISGNKLTYAGANNPLWIIRAGKNEIEEIKADKQPIGSFYDPLPYTTHSVEVNKGDIIYVFTDGYADQFGGDKGKKMKTVNFKKLLLSLRNKSMAEQLGRLDDAFDEWKGEIEQIDDVCVIGVKV